MQEDWIKTLGKMTYGIYVMTTFHDDEINGMIASWVSQISYHPLLVMAAVHPNRYSHRLIEKSGYFALHVIDRGQKEFLARFKGPDPAGKFSSVQWQRGQTGCPILTECMAYLECRVNTSYKPGKRPDGLIHFQLISGTIPKNIGVIVVSPDIIDSILGAGPIQFLILTGTRVVSINQNTGSIGIVQFDNRITIGFRIFHFNRIRLTRYSMKLHPVLIPLCMKVVLLSVCVVDDDHIGLAVSIIDFVIIRAHPIANDRILWHGDIALIIHGICRGLIGAWGRKITKGAFVTVITGSTQVDNRQIGDRIQRRAGLIARGGDH